MQILTFSPTLRKNKYFNILTNIKIDNLMKNLKINHQGRDQRETCPRGTGITENSMKSYFYSILLYYTFCPFFLILFDIIYTSVS